MPHSLVFNLLPLSPIYPNYLSGRHLHALFLTLVSSVDQSLGDYLHQEKADKAFTLSPLQTLRKHDSSKEISRCRNRLVPVSSTLLQWKYHQPILPEIPCWWRISLLDDALFGRLTQLWLNINPKQPWHLGAADLQVTSILGTVQSTQPWSNTCLYEQLYEQASETERSFHFTFATPTAFRQGQYDTSLPTREAVFNSLLNRWNKYSKIPISEIAIESIFPSFFDIRTEMVADSRSKFIGCTGEIHYRILGDVEPIQIKYINALADFAFYCGIGRKTPMGMGMTRRIYRHG